MYQRDHALDDDLFFDGPGYTIVVRPPGGSTITVPAHHHFLDVHLGKSKAKYEVSGLEDLGSTAPPSTFVFLPANGQREVKATRSGWSVQIAFDASQVEFHPKTDGKDQAGPQDGLGLRAICHAEDEAMIGVALHLSGCWMDDLPRPTEEEFRAVAVLLMLRVKHHILHEDPRPNTYSASKRIQRVIDHIEANVGHGHTLEELAGIAGVSPYHFSRVFRRATGRNPHQYVVERRLAHAKRMLRNSDEAIVSIAYDCGFSSQSHMTDVFSKVLGTTPGKVRRETI